MATMTDACWCALGSCKRKEHTIPTTTLCQWTDASLAFAVLQVEFLMFHFFPRFSDMDAKVRSTAMCELVLPDLASLVQVSS